MSTRLFDYDPITKTTQLFHTLPDGTYVIESLQDCTEIVEHNKDRSNNARGDWKAAQHWVAAIPMIELEKLIQKQILSPGLKVLDKKKWKAFLNDRDNEYMRTKRGRV